MKAEPSMTAQQVNKLGPKIFPTQGRLFVADRELAYNITKYKIGTLMLRQNPIEKTKIELFISKNILNFCSNRTAAL